MKEIIPVGKITTCALYSLASALKRLQAWHVSLGGQSQDEPCLREIRWDEVKQRAVALVLSGREHYELVYKNDSWTSLGGDVLKDD